MPTLKTGQVLSFGGRYKVKLQFHHLVRPHRKSSQWYYRCAFMPFINAPRGSWSLWRHFSSPRLASCCGSWLKPVFSSMVGYWLSWKFSSPRILISTAGIFAEHLTVTTSNHYKGADVCFASFTPTRRYILWVPCLTFDAILAILAVWAGVKHSKQRSYSRSIRNKPRLVDVLIQGNVVYFLR